jgi:hypothetical protein
LLQKETLCKIISQWPELKALVSTFSQQGNKLSFSLTPRSLLYTYVTHAVLAYSIAIFFAYWRCCAVCVIQRCVLYVRAPPSIISRVHGAFGYHELTT